MTPEVPAELAIEDPHTALTAVGLLNAYVPIFAVAFLTSLLATPLVRRFAVAQGIVDRPDAVRKLHAFPIAYLGGVSIFAAIIAGVMTSYMLAEPLVLRFEPVPIAVLIGVLAIAFTGLADDVWGFDPRLKIAGQLVAAAALAVQDVGVRVAEGLLAPLIGAASVVILDLGGVSITNQDVFYWVGTALVAIFVLGGCNAANFLDGLDGLLSGTVAIMAVGFLAISIAMAIAGGAVSGEESLSGARIVLSFALLGAVLGFLPYNFNPAVIFLGDCGSLLLGYLCAVLILMFGDEGKTHLVFAGLIVFSVPIIDTALAILRRRLAGVPMATADTNHIHHQLRRSLGGVKRAVFAIYGITAAFAAIGFTLAWMVLETIVRFRVIYAVAAVLFGFIAAFAFKAARRVQWEAGLATATTPPAASSRARSAATPEARPAAAGAKEESAPTP
jgi:UDP-GlcNAc:undecaprenyl-phosphate/decaprenyl-phosphate GlcNAc-1-phosphate transferase